MDKNTEAIEVFKDFDMYYGQKAYIPKYHTDELIEAIHYAIPILENYNKIPPKVNEEYFCEHIERNEIGGDCLWCHLTVVEKGLEVQRNKYQNLLKMVDVDKIVDLLVNTIHLDEPLKRAGAIVNGKDNPIDIVKDIAQAIVKMQKGEK